ncbi:MAG: TonB-dependent receptor plug domain-containing protein, partial [Treponema sp.]|nr:TonB-dependent receptor plug domain-containing protein [Treponema sp.]
MPYIYSPVRQILRSMPFILFFILTGHMYARDITIIVEDIELDMPLEGAVVRVESGGAGGAEKTTDENGWVALVVPDNRQTRLQIAYPGYENAIFIAPPSGTTFTVGLRLSGGAGLENRELVIEAQKPGESETKTGRSVAISGEDLARTAEIGVIEDVMTSIKLLPGVGYTGMFNAMPSIRGGEPGDLTAVFDGFYIENPYHWGGGVSIFDPRMAQSAQLSHGVFSSRYGHTISGLLEITGRKPEPLDVELELGLSSSAANLNVSYPLFGKGGVMIMGKATYWDPFVSLAKLAVDEVNYIKIAPYIRSAAFGANYRFTQNFEGTMFGFIGGDGAGAYYNNPVEYNDMTMHTDFDFEWFNLQGFLIAGLVFNPKPSMALKASLGGGFLRTNLHGFIDYYLTVPYSESFFSDFGGKTFLYPPGVSITSETYTVDTTMFADMVDTTANYQARVDYDWDVGKGFLFAAGVQGLYTRYELEEHDQAMLETSGAFLTPVAGAPIPAYYNMPYTYNNSSANQTLTSSAYTLLEYASPKKRFGGELGFRVDHLLFAGKDFTLQTLPTLNPRLNLDWNIAQNAGVFDAITATIGSGLFSSITDNISSIQSGDGIGGFELKQNRSWTSIAGIKLDFLGFSVNLEGYYKYVFDRAYSRLAADSANQTLAIERAFDGEGRIWGFDVMLQKTSSRYWDGWISYSFNWAR